MGAGVGSYIRIAIELASYKSFVEFKYYSGIYLCKIYNLLRYKFPINFKVFSNK